MRLHVGVVDAVFEAASAGAAQHEDDTSQVSQAVRFHPATVLDESAIAPVQAAVRKRILRAFVARGHLEAHEAKDMAAYALGAVQSGPK